jgi:hypothetical protein
VFLAGVQFIPALVFRYSKGISMRMERCSLVDFAKKMLRIAPAATLLVALSGENRAANAQSMRMTRGQGNCATCTTCPPQSPSPFNPQGSGNGAMTPNGQPSNPDAQSVNPDGTLRSNENPNAAQDPNNPLTQPDQVFNDNARSENPILASNSNPGSIGDFFGSVSILTGYNLAGGNYIGSPNGGATTTAPGPYSPLGGRQKLVEHDNPLPRDRVFVNYSYFKDVPLVPGGIDVNRVTFGGEKTCLDGMASIQVRVPTVSTLNSDIQTNSSGIPVGDSDYQLGNVNLTAKLLLHQTDACALSVGAGVTLPTADDTRLFGSDGLEALRYKNEAVHVLPYVGFVVTPNDRLFSQALLQLDFDTNGNTVEVVGATRRNDIGKLKDATFAYASWTTGYWLVKEMIREQIDFGIAPMFEVHYNRSLSNPDTASGTVDGATFAIGEPSATYPGSRAGSFEAVNLTFGIHSQCSRSCTVTAGYCIPAGGLSREDQFNGEARLLFNYFFGK